MPTSNEQQQGAVEQASLRTSDEPPKYCVIGETVEASKGPRFYIWERGTGRYVVGKLEAEQASIVAGELNALFDAAPAVPQDMAGMVERYSQAAFAGGLGASRPAIEAFAKWVDAHQQPSPVPVGEDDVALELLAAEFEQAGWLDTAREIRADVYEQHSYHGKWTKHALAAIKAALTRAGQDYGRGVRECDDAS